MEQGGKRGAYQVWTVCESPLSASSDFTGPFQPCPSRMADDGEPFPGPDTGPLFLLN